MAAYMAMSFHPGEEQMHRRTRVATRDNPTHPTLPGALAHRISLSPLIALGTTDPETGDIWTTLWGGAVPTAQLVARGGILGVRTNVDVQFDPVVEVLYGGKDDGEVIQEKEPSKGKMVSGLSILLEERDRVKFFGKMIAGALSSNKEIQAQSEAEATQEKKDDGTESSSHGKIGNAQLVVHVTQSLGNCPKYLNKKTITPYANAKPQLLSKNIQLNQKAIELINQADLFFISSCGPEDMDTNHRGGPPGFIRVQQSLSDDSSSTNIPGTKLIWPEYSGNNLYQTLGNFMHDKHAGIVIPNFTTGDVLYLTGQAEVLFDNDAASLIAKTRLAVSFSITGARHVQDGLSFRGVNIPDKTQGRSPYNPRIRYLASEKSNEFGTHLPPSEGEQRFSAAATGDVMAKLIKKTQLSPTVHRYRFALSDPTVYGPWLPGQYVALDFSDELFNGYTHMNDSDPQSLNDDFLRTFTVASPPGKLGMHGEEFEVVVRTVGSVTRWLTGQRPGIMEVRLQGFAGEFVFDGSKKGAFVAAGIGITPLLGQMGVVKNLKVLWTTGVKDVGVIVDVLEECSDEVKKNMTVYLTGDDSGLDAKLREQMQLVMEKSGVNVERRRLTKEDLEVLVPEVEDWYLCTAPAMRNQIQEWLPGTVIHFENFDY